MINFLSNFKVSPLQLFIFMLFLVVCFICLRFIIDHLFNPIVKSSRSYKEICDTFKPEKENVNDDSASKD